VDRVGAVLVETYRITRLIAEGGMGDVYEAQHVRVPKKFAVKFLKGALVDKAEALARFRREAEIIATLDHPNIVTLFDYNIGEDGIPYIVLEFLDGDHLGRVIAGGALSLAHALRIVDSVARALEAAHKLDVIHRDLKPENVILCTNGTI
jgi:serine/threonine-protein kinase